MQFIENTDMPLLAEEYSQNCVDVVKEMFDIELDWSDSSIQIVEELLASLNRAVNSDNPPSPQRISDFGRIFGFYIGEVYRKNHGGVIWGDVIDSSGKTYGLGRSDTKEAFFWPVEKVYKRIDLGSEENIWVYYNVLLEQYN